MKNMETFESEKNQEAELRKKFEDFKRAEIEAGHDFLVRDINPDELTFRDLEIFQKFHAGNLTEDEFGAYGNELFPVKAGEHFQRIKSGEISLKQGEEIARNHHVNRSSSELYAYLANKCSSPEWKKKWESEQE